MTLGSHGVLPSGSSLTTLWSGSPVSSTVSRDKHVLGVGLGRSRSSPPLVAGTPSVVDVAVVEGAMEGAGHFCPASAWLVKADRVS